MSDRPIAGSAPVSPVAITLLACMAVFAALLGWQFVSSAHGLFPDGFGLWSFGRFVALNPPASIYDPQAVWRFQAGLGLPPASFYPFGYPPPFLLLLAPLAWLPYPAAATIWAAATLGAYGLVVVAGGGRRAWLNLAMLSLAPATIIALVFGQTGLLFAAVLIGGLRLVDRRPWLGGAVLGLMICKPQLALLVPVALLAAGRPRALAGAALSSLALMAGAAAAFGPQLCLDWPQAMLSYAGVFRAGSGEHWSLMPTLTVTALQAGLPDHIAGLLQLGGALAAAVLTWRAFQVSHPARLTVFAAAAFLATPYAFVYDLPLLTAALVIELPASPLRLPGRQIAGVGITLCTPMLMFVGLPVGLMAVTTALLVAWQTGRSGAAIKPAGSLSYESADKAGSRLLGCVVG